ncbi:katanin p80 wd40-containing subunit b1 [Lasius niger]|uniref:Katanin p80 wd40-containing subunit b1 n=1 Tax=Lasius niger TaxID=67767 RepID=A0A0J7KQH7_LASNI|nr:katanin p80 wd40-containing subunit b1 [Lasius niger]
MTLTGPATTVEFHPHEFLLASGSADRTVHFWDLETFDLVSSTDQSHSSAIRCLYFSQGGECLFVGSHDVLKVYGWEPGRTLDTIPTGWGKIQDIAVAQNQLIGASFHTANVILYVCDLKKIAPLGGISAVNSPFSHGNSLRKSFSRERPIGLKKHTLDVRTIEEADKSGTDDPEDEATYADIPNVTEYRDIFQPSRALSRTPPPESEAFQEPHDIDPTQPQILQNLSTSMSNLSTMEREEVPPVSLPSSPPPPAPTLSLMKPVPVPVRVQPIKSSPPIQRNPITSTSQIRANLQANNGLNQRASKNFASIPPLRQNITPLPGKRVSTTDQAVSASPQPLGPQRSNSTLTPRVAPMAAVIPVMDDGKMKNRVPSPDSPKHYLKRQSSRDGEQQGYESDYPVQINNIRHSPSDPALNRPNTAQSRSTSLNRNFATSTALSARNASTTTSLFTRKPPNKAQIPPNPKVDVRVSQIRNNVEDTEKEELVPMSADKPYGLDVENFLPHSYTGSTSLDYSQMGVLTEMSEAEVLNSMMRSHDSMMAVLKSRHRSLQIIYSLWHNKDLKAAVESAVAMNDLAIIVDLLGILTLKPYITVACSALRLILRNFAPVIKSNVEAPLHTIGVDVSREERYHKCLSCYEKLSAIRAILLKKQPTSGKLGASFRELAVLIRNLE